MNWLEKILEYISSFLLILIGLVGVAIGLDDFLEWKLLTTIAPKEPNTLILLTVGAISLALGLERVIRFRRLDQHIGQIENLVASSSGGRLLKGYNAIYTEGIRIVSTTQRQIRALLFEKAPKAPKEFAQALAIHLKQSEKARAPIKYEVVIAVNFNTLTSQFQKNVDERFNIYSRAGVGHLVFRFLIDLNKPIGFDLLIVDDKHVIIAFPPLGDVENLQTGILFENKSEVAAELASWFDQCVRSPNFSVKYEDWVQSRARTQSGGELKSIT